MNTPEIIGLIIIALLMVVFWAICAIGGKAEQEENKIMEKENGKQI